MTSKTLDQKTKALEKEVELLRSFVIGQAGQDPEGTYNPAFVKRALKAAQEEPQHEFKDTTSFLRQVQGK